MNVDDAARTIAEYLVGGPATRSQLTEACKSVNADEDCLAVFSREFGLSDPPESVCSKFDANVAELAEMSPAQREREMPELVQHAAQCPRCRHVYWEVRGLWTSRAAAALAAKGRQIVRMLSEGIRVAVGKTGEIVEFGLGPPSGVFQPLAAAVGGAVMGEPLLEGAAGTPPDLAGQEREWLLEDEVLDEDDETSVKYAVLIRMRLRGSAEGKTLLWCDVLGAARPSDPTHEPRGDRAETGPGPSRPGRSLLLQGQIGGLPEKCARVAGGRVHDPHRVGGRRAGPHLGDPDPSWRRRANMSRDASAGADWLPGGRKIITQSLKVSFKTVSFKTAPEKGWKREFLEDKKQEFLEYEQRLPHEDAPRNPVQVEIEYEMLRDLVTDVRDSVKRLLDLALSGQLRAGEGAEAAATALTQSILPPSGLAEVVAAGMHPQFDIIEDAAAEIPWEVLDEHYYCCPNGHRSYAQTAANVIPHCRHDNLAMSPASGKLSLGRHLTHLVRGDTRPLAKGNEFLFIADPTGDLCNPDRDPGGCCAEHLAKLRALIEGHGYGIRCLPEGCATRRAVLEALRDPAVIGLYYFGHGLFPADKNQGRLVLSDGHLFAQQIEQAAPGTSFIFLNACEAAATGREWVLDREKRARSVAEAFARGGGRVVIGSPVARGQRPGGAHRGRVLRAGLLPRQLDRRRPDARAQVQLPPLPRGGPAGRLLDGLPLLRRSEQDPARVRARASRCAADHASGRRGGHALPGVQRSIADRPGPLRLRRR